MLDDSLIMWAKHAVLEFIYMIITQMDQDKIPINIYLDLSKDVDTIDHLIVIDKLKYYDMNGTNLNVFGS